MDKSHPDYSRYIDVLKEELLPAMGCTEPIAIAYAAAVARKTLGVLPDRVEIACSGNIIKNVKSVIVPNSGGMKGIPAAAAAGITVGDPDRQLEVLAGVKPEQVPEIKAFLDAVPVTVELAETPYVLDILITLHSGGSCAKVRIEGHHTHIILIEKDGAVLKSDDVLSVRSVEKTDRTFMTVAGILDFADSVDVADVMPILEPQARCNTAIAEEGLRGNYGANIGKVILNRGGDPVLTKAKAMAAAGSDARMNGCEMPVIINSGSGNQGITVSVPIVVYAREKGLGEEKMYRALALSNLLAIHQRDGMGSLSAYCGAVNAGIAAGCAIAYLDGGGLDVISHTLVNALAVVSGIVCDGAKASCAAKIAVSVDAGLLGYEMYLNGQQFYGGDGIVKKGVENTIFGVDRLARDGMRETDREILHIMIGD